MSFAPPEQQSAARQMKQVKLHKSAKPGKIDRHGASLAKRSALRHREAVAKINQVIAQLRFARWNAASTACRAGTVEDLPATAARSSTIAALQDATGTSRLRSRLKQLLSALKGLFCACFVPAGSSGGASGGGGGVRLRNVNSGTDPPKHRFGLPLVKLAFTFALVAAATAVPMKGESALISDYSFNQDGGQSGVTFYLTNNDGSATYDSAVMKFDEIFNLVAQAVKNNNSDYSSSALEDIKGGWDVRIRNPPTGEVVSGWLANLNSGNLDLSHGLGFIDFDYDGWYSTSQNSSQDEMAINVNFFDQLDFNHNGQFDAGIEQLAQLDSKVADGFTGYDAIGNDFSTDVNQVGVVPEPATMTMLGVAGLLIAAKRRFFG